MPPLSRGVFTLCPHLCKLPLCSLAPFVLQSCLSSHAGCTFPRSELLLSDCQKLPLLRLVPAATPGSAARRDALPACQWLDGRRSGQAACHISWAAWGKESSLSWGQVLPSRGFIWPDQSSWLVFLRAKALVPQAARKLDIKMAAAVSPPWHTLARRKKRGFSSLRWPCQETRAGWEMV